MNSSLPNLDTLWKNHKFILVIFVIVFFLRLPSLFEPYSYGDEGIYLTLGEAAKQGLVFYRDIYDNKPPLLYLLAALTGSLFWFRFLLLVWNLATIYLFSRLVKTFFPKNHQLNKIMTLIFAIFSSLPVLEGNIANAEIFMILPTIAGFLLLIRSKNISLQGFFMIGVLFSFGALFKIPASFDFLAVLVFLIFFIPRGKFNLPAEFKKWLFLVLGFWVPILLTIFYYWTQGALVQYLTAAFSQNIPYLSSWGGGSSSGLFGSGLVRRGVLLIIGVSIIFLLRKKWSKDVSLILVWFLFALFGATLSGRPYPHYLLQVLPPLVLLLGVFGERKIWPKAAASFLIVTLFLATIYFKFWSYPTLSYYQNFLSFALGQKNKEDYLRHFGEKVIRNYRLAQFLQTATKSNEKIFIWGDSPVIYALARRLPVGRYTAAYHIIDFNGYEETIEALKNRPRIIIDLGEKDHPFPQLETFLAENYFLITNLDEAKVYHLGTWK